LTKRASGDKLGAGSGGGGVPRDSTAVRCLLAIHRSPPVPDAA